MNSFGARTGLALLRLMGRIGGLDPMVETNVGVPVDFALVRQ